MQVEVRLRVGHDADPGAGDVGGDAALVGLGQHAEADAVAGGHTVGEPGVDGSDQVEDAERRRVEGLVGVQVDTDTVIGGDAEQALGGRRRAVGFEVGTATHQVGAEIERIAEQGPPVGSGDARHRRFAQRHDLDVDDVGQQLACRQHALDRDQSACLGDVDMGANGRVSAARHQATGSDGAGGDVRGRGVGERGQHAVDGAGEIAGRVGHDVGEERLVEMGVRLDGRRQQHEPVEIDVLGCLAGTTGCRQARPR